ncbi:PTS glucitol/sorbitol transporter subunit IIC [Enterococcus pallens]|uniref:PTS system, glucitol/sorbitol-specific, IIC component n=1 Tax=Enterococcus pallens ATCC BAA-351 TaxID=1158607 RepID=R2QHU4_9ENTE|nr:PTS glucitol/sorbitol transporter subunit IIC [Enterococcus pallens]EOH94768.1 PTS system, glucitol/sorbitol-specific, IIC component [Enterococcus pallens ATCC BAA-351]EOU14913.1 hypothetical protein I588_04563 [Enterococcus pallens ATCC BAA-351]
MDLAVKLAEGFTGIFQAGGENLMGLVTGILPTLLVLLTFVNALIAIIGEDRVTHFSQKMTKFRILRYTLLPVMSLFFLTNPMCYTMGRFLDEKEKPAFIDACFSFAHPITGIFPHGNAGELFVWTGISSGITALGYSVSPLAIRYFLAGIIIIFIRGMVTEFLTRMIMAKSETKKEVV